MTSGPYVVGEYEQANDSDRDTAAIQSAIDACHRDGGGTVRVPAGEYVTGPLFLRDDITVHLEAGATVMATEDFNAYPTVDGRWEGHEREEYAALFNARDVSNVAITGRGSIDGSGAAWWDAYEAATETHELGRDNPYPAEGPFSYPRPRVFQCYESSNVVVRDVTVRNAPAWTLHFVYCEGITVEGVTVRNPFESPNTDGVVLDSTRDARVTGCTFDVGDDCIALKAGCDEDGRRVDRPCEDVTVSDCRMTGGYSALAIGSETAGDVRSVTLDNCVATGLLSGIRIKSALGRGGVVEDIQVNGLVTRDLKGAILELTMFYGDDHEEEATDVVDPAAVPTFRNVAVSDVIASAVERVVSIAGLPSSPIRHVTVSDIRGRDVESFGSIERAEHIQLRNVFDDGSRPSGLVTNNVTDISIDN